MKNFILLKDDTIKINGHTLYRIKALRDIRDDVLANTTGGYVEKEENLSQDDISWIWPGAKVYGNVKIFGNSAIMGDVQIAGNVSISHTTMLGHRSHINIIGNGHICIYNGRFGASIGGEIRICNSLSSNQTMHITSTEIFGNVRITDSNITASKKEKISLFNNTVIVDSIVTKQSAINDGNIHNSYIKNAFIRNANIYGSRISQSTIEIADINSCDYIHHIRMRGDIDRRINIEYSYYYAISEATCYGPKDLQSIYDPYQNVDVQRYTFCNKRAMEKPHVFIQIHYLHSGPIKKKNVYLLSSECTYLADAAKISDEALAFANNTIRTLMNS